MLLLNVVCKALSSSIKWVFMAGFAEKIYINTFGCKTNQYDSALLAQVLEEKGYEITGDFSSADWVVVNTCSVTRRGEDKARQWVRKVKRENPGVKIAVVGCAVESSVERFIDLPGVCLLLGTEEKSRLGDFLAGPRKNGSGWDDEPLSYRGSVQNAVVFGEAGTLKAHRDRSRAFVKIQDGCDNRCAYCIVPFTRGRSRSRSLEEIIAEIKALESAGHMEVVLTGIHIGVYGRDLSENLSLAGLIEEILLSTSIIRFRLSSLEAGELDNRLTEFLANERRICRHLHIPLQHGSESVLERMGRKYTPHDYRSQVGKLAGLVPGLGLGTDIIVGFPGETENEFEECLSFIESLPFTYLHVFPFSPRPGTRAASLGNRPDKAVVRQRVKVLRELSEKKKRFFLESLFGKMLIVLQETSLPSSGISVSRADNYARVYHQGPGTEGFFELTAERLFRDGVWGNIRANEKSN